MGLGLANKDYFNMGNNQVDPHHEIAIKYIRIESL